VGSLPGTVLVTGAMGQVGALLSALLLERDRTVIAVDLRSKATEATAGALAAAARPGRFRAEYADITSAEAVRAVVQAHAPEAVVHLAAVVSPPCYRDPERAHRVNVDGTRNLADAARALPQQPSFVLASSAGVYGSRNPYSHPGRITPATPASPVECYGEDKIMAEEIVARSGLRHATLRLAGIVSPNAPSGPDYLVLARAIPRDNRVHMVDARDVALAFANAADRIDDVNGKVLLIGGNETYALRHSSVQDDMFDAVGLGRLGPGVNLPGNPEDDSGWSFTDWFDTTESQALLGYQKHDWSDTLSWVRASHRRRRMVLRGAGPLARPLIRAALGWQQRRDGRGPYADPWALIAKVYGDRVLAAAPKAG
jgi:nucleoside-diphosphate-sugar epimerase